MRKREIPIPVGLEISEPWGFPYRHFSGNIVQIGYSEEYYRGTLESCLVRCVHPLEYKKSLYQCFVVINGREQSLQPLFDNGELPDVSAVGVPDDRVQSDSPLDISWWRGGTPWLRGRFFLV